MVEGDLPWVEAFLSHLVNLLVHERDFVGALVRRISGIECRVAIVCKFMITLVHWDILVEHCRCCNAFVVDVNRLGGTDHLLWILERILATARGNNVVSRLFLHI